MEQTQVKRRSASPSINGLRSSSWNTARGSSKHHGHEPPSRIPTKPGSRYIRQSSSAAVNKDVQQPKTESNSDLEDKDIKEESSPDASLTPSTPNAAQQQPKQKSPSKKSHKPPVQLIPGCPRAEKAALATFEELDTNWHQYKYLGKSKVQEDAMACECQLKPGFYMSVAIIEQCADQLQAIPWTAPVGHIPIASTGSLRSNALMESAGVGNSVKTRGALVSISRLTYSRYHLGFRNESILTSTSYKRR